MLRVESSKPLDEREELRQLVAGLRRHLETKARAGIRAIPKTLAARAGMPPMTPSKPTAAVEDNLFIAGEPAVQQSQTLEALRAAIGDCRRCKLAPRSEEHTSELQSHSFISYAVFCLKKQ